MGDAIVLGAPVLTRDPDSGMLQAGGPDAPPSSSALHRLLPVPARPGKGGLPRELPPDRGHLPSPTGQPR
jgi:hypothetical protein